MMWLKKLAMLCLLLGCLAKARAQDTLAYWGFNEAGGSTTKETISNTDFTIRTKWPVVERVSGVRQSALRTDGYTVYVDGTTVKPYPADSFSVSFWLALETYPVNTAAVWSYFDPAANQGTVVGVDRYGRLNVRTTVNGQPENFTSTIRLEHYKWNYVVVNVDAVNGTCTAHVNAVPVINETIRKGTLTWPTTTLFIGRGAATEKQDIFPLNYLNGIYDEIIVRKRMLAPTQIQAEYSAIHPSTPPQMETPSTRFATDFHRPKYHAIPNNGWANESHGLIYFGGKYHLFFQKNGNGPFFSQQNWGHLVSSNLLDWKEVQPALFPQPGWESVGIWSGHLVLDHNGTPTIFYTAVDGIKAGIGSAQSTGDLLTWQRNPANPLIPGAPTAYPNRDFRDPYVFKEGNTWYMLIGSGLQNPSTGTVFLYKSGDLGSWQFLKPLFTDLSGMNSVGNFWEMPVFWKFGNRYLLLVNKTPQGANPARAFYWAGDFSNETYTVNNIQVKNLEIINSLLSPSVNVDAQGRVVAMGIIPDLLPQSEQYKKGWTHLFSLPRVWQLQNDSLFQSPHPVLDETRGQLTTIGNVEVTNGGAGFLKMRGFQAEIRGTLQPGSATKAGFVLGKNDNGTEYTRIYYDYTGNSFVVDRTKSSANPATPRDFQAEYFPLPQGQPVDWHIYLDGSVIEVFINNKWAFATRIFPESYNSNTMDLFAEGGSFTATDVKVWNRGNLDVVTGIFSPRDDNFRSLKVWPTPATNQYIIEVPAALSAGVLLNIYNLAGQRVRQISKRPGSATKIIEWDLRDDAGKKVLPGAYYGDISAGKVHYQSKMMVNQ